VGSQDRTGQVENLVPTGIRSQTVQPVAQSLYRLSYQAHNISTNTLHTGDDDEDGDNNNNNNTKISLVNK